MATTLIKITDFCNSHGIETTYIETLEGYGLVQLREQEFIDYQELPKVEKIIRLNRDMNINFEGIDVILNLLDRMESLNREQKQLRRRLKLYEDIE